MTKTITPQVQAALQDKKTGHHFPQKEYNATMMDLGAGKQGMDMNSSMVRGAIKGEAQHGRGIPPEAVKSYC